MWLSRSLAALLILVCATAGARAQIEDVAPLIGKIEFLGNDSIEAGELRAAMRLRQPSSWRPLSKPRFPGADFLAGDLEEIGRVYQDEGFPFAEIVEAVVEYSVDGTRVDIVIEIDEGVRVEIGAIEIEGVDAKDSERLRGAIDLAPGDWLRTSKLEAAEQTILGVFQERGRGLVRTLRDVRIGGGRADVIFRVDSGPEVRIDSVYIAPLERTLESTVRHELRLREGDLLRPKGLLETRRRLLDTGIFRSVRVQPVIIDSTIATAVLEVTSRERQNSWVGGGAGYSSADQLRFLAEWGLRNISGAGRRLALNGELFYSLDPEFRDGGASFQEAEVRADYLQPQVFGSRNRATFTNYLRWLQEESFHERIFGYSIGLFREFGLHTRARVSLETREVSTTEAGVQPRYTTRFVRLTGTNDHRDNPFDAKRGRYLQGQIEYAGGLLGGTNEFGRTAMTWQRYRSSDSGWVLATRARAGWIRPFSDGLGDASDSLRVARVPWEERFRLGGSNTVRGYRENDLGRHNDRDEAIGGLALFLANVEVRFPLFWILRAGVFIDAGNVWADPSELKPSRWVEGLSGDSYDPLQMFYGIGGGLRFVTPVGPFRFDYGYKIGSGREPNEPTGQLHVALGQAF